MKIYQNCLKGRHWCHAFFLHPFKLTARQVCFIMYMLPNNCYFEISNSASFRDGNINIRMYYDSYLSLRDRLSNMTA